MLTVITKSGTNKKFNLKSVELEKEFRNAWYSMQDMEEKRGKMLKATSDQGNFLFKINNIAEVKFDDCHYAVAEVSTEKPKPKEDKAQSYLDDMDKIYGKIDSLIDSKKKIRRKVFIDYLLADGVVPDFNDPLFLKALQSAEDSDDWKIKMFANIYKNAKGRG